MEIVLKRIAKKGTYTIGRLYLLTDSSVNRNSLHGKKLDDKRILIHTFDSQLQALVAIAGGCAEFRGHPHSCRQLS